MRESEGKFNINMYSVNQPENQARICNAIIKLYCYEADTFTYD